jgi:signal transduction histidine kinase
MTKTGFISIRSKILFVLIAMLVSAVGLYLYLASQIFFEDKKLLVYELNQTNVRTLGQEVETYFKRVIDKLQIVASLQHKDANAASTVLSQLISEDEGFLKVALIDQVGEGANANLQTTVLGTWPKTLELAGKDASYLDQIRQAVPIPFERVIKEGVWIRNATLSPKPGEELPAILTLASRVGDNEIVYVDLRLDSVLSAFTRSGLAQTYLMDSDGFALADSDHKKISTPTDLKADPLMASAQTSKLRSELKSYRESNTDYLGSFFKLGLANLVVASKIQSDEAFSAAQVLFKKSLLYALIVITAAFLIALFLSHSLTTPIRRMVEATQRIASGDFDVSLPVKSGDELAYLSASFNSMNANLKTSRDQIQEYSRDLEKKVAERTVQLEEQNVAIKEAQEALIRTTRLASVGEVAGRAAHEVLNPLTSILTRLEKLQNQVKTEESDDLSLFSEIISAWQKSLSEGGQAALMQALSAPSQAKSGKSLLEEDIENLGALASDFSKRQNNRQADFDFLTKESQRITKIVNGMRQLTRVSGNRKTVSANQTLQESVATMKDVLSKNKIKVETQFTEENPKIQVDPDEVLQVMSNLMRNSMQAFQGYETPNQKQITITTSVANEGETRTLQIRFADNGPGIAVENQSKIFEPTFSTKSVEEGTGLGLAICRRFIRAYEGEIVLEKSEPGNTVFLIELPEVAGASAGQTSGGTA